MTARLLLILGAMSQIVHADHLLTWGATFNDTANDLGVPRSLHRYHHTPTVEHAETLRFGHNYAGVLTYADQNGVVQPWSGHVWMYGTNEFGQLGVGDKVDRDSPQKIPGLERVVKLELGFRHSGALLGGGSVVMWGCNDYGQLGLGDRITRTSPTLVPGLTNVVDLSLGMSFHSPHSGAVDEDGQVWMWGRNDYGQLGLHLGMQSQYAYLTPTLLVLKDKVAEVYLGFRLSAFVLNDRSVLMCGRNDRGQLGLGDTQPRELPTAVPGLKTVIQMGFGDRHSGALLADGTMMLWGDNSYGQLGLGLDNVLQREFPTKVPGLAHIIQIAFGYDHTGALLDDRSIRLWGCNFDAELGLGDTIDRASPARVEGFENVKQLSLGFDHSGITYAPRVVVWGDYQWGLDDSKQSLQTPTPMPDLMNVVQLKFGRDYTGALKEDRTVHLWGKNEFGQLGVGDKVDRDSPQKIPGLERVVKLELGFRHSGALLGGGSVVMWGCNDYGQLGLGDRITRTSPTLVPGLTNVVDLSLGMSFHSPHSGAVDEDGQVWMWGRNDYGQLGMQDPSNSIDRLNPTMLPHLRAASLQLGFRVSAAILPDQTVSIWGRNDRGQLGLRFSFDSVSNDLEVIYSPTTIKNLHDVIQIEFGDRHSAVLLGNGTVMAWGDNKYGQLGYPGGDRRSPYQVNTVGIPDSELPYSPVPKVIQISLGYRHTGALLDNGKVLVWGDNSFFQLGLDESGMHTANRTTPTVVPNLGNVIQLAFGHDHSAARLGVYKAPTKDTNTTISSHTQSGTKHFTQSHQAILILGLVVVVLVSLAFCVGLLRNQGRQRGMFATQSAAGVAQPTAPVPPTVVHKAQTSGGEARTIV